MSTNTLLHLKLAEPCSTEGFNILDTASSGFQLKIKEVMYIQWEKPILSHQVKHVNLSLSMKPNCYLCCFFFSSHCSSVTFSFQWNRCNWQFQIVTSFYNWRWHKFAETCLVNWKLLPYFFKSEQMFCSRVRLVTLCIYYWNIARYHFTLSCFLWSRHNLSPGTCTKYQPTTFQMNTLHGATVFHLHGT